MRRAPRSLVFLMVVTTLVAASCSGGGGEFPPLGDDFSGAARTTVAGSPVDTTDEPALISSPPPPTAPDVFAAGDQISIADSDPDAIIEVGGTLLQTDRIVVVLEADSPRPTAEGVAAALGGDIIGELSYIDLYQVSVPGGDETSVRAAVDQAAQLPGVDLAYADELMTLDDEIWGIRTSPLEDDPVYAGKTGDGYRAIGVNRAWQYIKGSGIEPWGVQVGIADSQRWTGTGEFDSAEMTSLEPTTDETDSPLVLKAPGDWQGEFDRPDGSHATGVATIIGADADDGGAAGVASILGDRLKISHSAVVSPGVGWYVPADADENDLTKYADPQGQTWSVKGIEAALKQVNAGATVINMSFGCRNCTPEVSTAYRRFFTQMERDHPDVVFVTTAGNNNGISPDGSRSYPGGMQLGNVITVGNVENDGTTSPSSNRSSDNFEVTIAAPGQQAVRGVTADGTVVDDTTVIGTATRTVNGQEQSWEIKSGGGTSMAAPQVTAAIALMKSLDPSLTAAEIKEILKQTARPAVPADAEADTYLPNRIDEKLGAGLLAVDEAVLAVVNRVRAANSLDPITGEQLVQFGVVDAVAVTGEPDQFTIRAIVTGCRGECTAVSISVSGDHALDGSTTEQLDAPGDVTWGLTVADDYPVTVFVQRLDNGAGSRILIDQAPIAGTWTGVFTLLEATVPEGEELPDGTISDGSTLTGDTLGACVTDAGAVASEAIGEMLDNWRDGFPITMVFSGTADQPGTVTITIEGADDDTITPWRMSGTSVVIEFVEDDSVVAFSGTINGQTMSGAWGAVQTDGSEMRGSFSVTRTGD